MKGSTLNIWRYRKIKIEMQGDGLENPSTLSYLDTLPLEVGLPKLNRSDL